MTVSSTARRDAVPATLLLGVTRIGLPASFTGCDFSAEQDLATATVHVNLTSKSGGTVSVSLFVSPLSPSVWTTISSSGTKANVAVTLSTTVLSHFYHREPHINTTFPVQTSAVCGASGATSTVTRASDFAESGLVITGAIQHTIRSPRGEAAAAAAPSCHTTGLSEATLSFNLPPEQPVSIVSVVRTSKDPACVTRLSAGGSVAAPLCGLSSNATLAAEAISQDLESVTIEQAVADHASSWEAFWGISSISLPSAPETEAYWYGAQYVLNSAVPHVGQEQTPPGLYGPWGSHDNPGWHGDYTIDYSKSTLHFTPDCITCMFIRDLLRRVSGCASYCRLRGDLLRCHVEQSPRADAHLPEPVARLHTASRAVCDRAFASKPQPQL